jgi:hypothetical protein
VFVRLFEIHFFLFDSFFSAGYIEQSNKKGGGFGVRRGRLYGE